MPKEQTVYVIIDTRDMDELDVYVYDTPKAASDRALGLLEEGDTDEEGEPIEPALKAWKGKDLEVWENEGRVAMTLRSKLVHK